MPWGKNFEHKFLKVLKVREEDVTTIPPVDGSGSVDVDDQMSGWLNTFQLFNFYDSTLFEMMFMSITQHILDVEVSRWRRNVTWRDSAHFECSQRMFWRCFVSEYVDFWTCQIDKFFVAGMMSTTPGLQNFIDWPDWPSGSKIISSYFISITPDVWTEFGENNIR